MNAQDKLLNEIERVVKIRTQYEAMDGMPRVNVRPAIAMMTASIEAAKTAAASDDAIKVIEALQDLGGYSE